MGFVSFLLKIPFIGIRKKLHHFLRSMLDRGLSSNFIFFSNNHPKFQRKVEVEFAFPHPFLEVEGGVVLVVVVSVVVEFANLFQLFFFH